VNKLFQEIAVCPVEFNAVKSCRNGVAGAGDMTIRLLSSTDPRVQGVNNFIAFFSLLGLLTLP
jgi:hypothetical protein